MTLVVQRSIDVEAPPETVWAVLSDLEHWPEWTASMTSVRRSRTGPLAVGEQVVVVQPRLPTLTYTVTEVDAGRSFTWEAGNAASRGVGEHVLTPRIAGGCTVTLRMSQRGPAARIVGVLLDRLTRRYLHLEAEGLKVHSQAAADRTFIERENRPVRLGGDPPTEQDRPRPSGGPGVTMSRPSPDPSRWLTDLMSTEHVLWPTLDIADTSKALAAAAAPWTKAIADLTALQMDALKTLTAPWTAMVPGTAAADEPIKDRRFADDAWTKDPRYEVVARTYLAQTDLLHKALDAAPIDDRSRAQWGFALRQVMDALSPANTLATNPEALQLALETGGASLLEGLRLFTEDLARGRIAMTDESAFEVGRNVGTTPGTVVFQNDLIQLIQYTPTTATVYRRPLVVIPPCINKYYILDLQPANSFVAHAVAEGHTVFLASWRNAGPEQGGLGWDDYVEQGVLRAVDVALEITDTDAVNTMGFCIGGTLLASALAVQAARGERPAASMTLLTTLLDYEETGDLGLLVTPEMVAARDRAIGGGGVLKGSELAQVFASLRANDLIWPYVVKGYLKGQAPPSFDLLYWNSDDTNLPGPMFCWYLRNCYLENKLREPGGVTVAGQPVDLRRIDLPTFVYASKEDHIVPWTSAYESTQLLSGEVTFVLGASGHIAGVINPPAKNKRNYWVASGPGAADASSAPTFDPDPQRWLESAEKVPGSWWPNWYAWLAARGGTKVDARKTPGNAEYRPVEEAPGSYVRAKAS